MLTLEENRLCRFSLSREQRLIGSLFSLSVLGCMVRFYRSKVMEIFVNCVSLVTVSQNGLVRVPGAKLPPLTCVPQLPQQSGLIVN